METTLEIHLKPRSKHNRVVSAAGTSVTVAVSAPPIDGKANEALIRLLAETLDIPKSFFRLVTGQTSRRKVVRVSGIGPDEAARRLAAATQ